MMVTLETFSDDLTKWDRNGTGEMYLHAQILHARTNCSGMKSFTVIPAEVVDELWDLGQVSTTRRIGWCGVHGCAVTRR